MPGASAAPRRGSQLAVRAQLLDAPRPTGPPEVMRHLCLVQIDLLAQWPGLQNDSPPVPSG